VITYLNGSTDQTESIVKTFPLCRIVHGEFHDDFARLRNDAISQCQNDHIFGLDGDEYIDPKVYYEIKRIFETTDLYAIRFPRYNQYTPDTYVPRFYPDYQTRALDRKQTHYIRALHEIVQAPENMIATSIFHIHHRAYKDIESDIEDYILQCKIAEKHISHESARARFQKAYTIFEKEAKPVPKQNLL